MPVFDKVLNVYIRKVVGDSISYNNVDQTMRVDDRILGPDERDEFIEGHADDLTEIFRRVDWNRVLLEATARHLKLDHADEGIDGYGVMDGNLLSGMICVECLEAALLARSTWPGW